MNILQYIRQGRWLILPVILVILTGCSVPKVVGIQTSITPHGEKQIVTTVLPTSTTFPGTTPTYTPYTALLAKIASVGPLYATGDKTVSQVALNDAGLTLAEMLHNRPDIELTLRQHGAFIAVASHDEHICDLPYFSMYNAQLCNRYGQGGAGGTMTNPVTACHEKNLLKDPKDAYERGQVPFGQNVCVHELAHMIMNVGVSQADFDRITARYQAAKQEGLWAGDYANTNEAEFWAVMSQFYFSAAPTQTYTPDFNHEANGPDALKKYDPATFQLLDSIYRGAVDLS